MLEAEELARERARREAFERAAKANPLVLEAPRMFRLKHDIVATRDGRPATIRKGSVVLESDPLLGEWQVSYHRPRFVIA